MKRPWAPPSSSRFTCPPPQTPPTRGQRCCLENWVACPGGQGGWWSPSPRAQKGLQAPTPSSTSAPGWPGHGQALPPTPPAQEQPTGPTPHRPPSLTPSPVAGGVWGWSTWAAKEPERVPGTQEVRPLLDSTCESLGSGSLGAGGAAATLSQTETTTESSLHCPRVPLGLRVSNRTVRGRRGT